MEKNKMLITNTGIESVHRYLNQAENDIKINKR